MHTMNFFKTGLGSYPGRKERKKIAKQTVRLNINISLEADKQLEEIIALLKPAESRISKTSIVEQGISRIYDEAVTNYGLNKMKNA